MSSNKSLAIQDTNITITSKTNKLLLEELKQLTAENRNLVQEEIHGVSSCAIPEVETTSSVSSVSSVSPSTSKLNSKCTNTTTAEDSCCCSAIQENGLKQLDIEIHTIREEILSNNNSTTPHESKDGNTYNETIWSYLCLEDNNNNTNTDTTTSTVDSPTTVDTTDTTGSTTAAASTTDAIATEATVANPNTTPTHDQQKSLYSYIYHKTFRLKFLRADMYDARKAAHRYLRCLECLLQYFGSYAFQRPLLYNDLCNKSQDAIKMGYVQVLPSRDRAGRLVVFVQDAMNQTTGHNMSIILKVFTYIFLVVSEDISTQKNGVIFIFSTDEKAFNMVQNINDRKEYALYREGSPVRRSCTHFCLPETNNIKMKHIRSVIMLAMSKEERVRTRIHMDGLTTETQSKLMTFGIPIHELPITSSGQMKKKHHLQWIKARKIIDKSRMKCLELCYSKKTKQYEQRQVVASILLERQAAATLLLEQQQQLQLNQQFNAAFNNNFHHEHTNYYHQAAAAAAANQQQQQLQAAANQHQQLQVQQLVQRYSNGGGSSPTCTINGSHDQNNPNGSGHAHDHICDSESLCCTYPTYDEYLSELDIEPIMHPMINDVLFSKGGKNVTHYGNIEFSDLMKRSLLQYVAIGSGGVPGGGGGGGDCGVQHAATTCITMTPAIHHQDRAQRKAIRQAIVDEIQSRGGRFLTTNKCSVKATGCWIEIDPGPDLHDRIATSLYDHKRRLAVKLKIKTSNCFTIGSGRGGAGAGGTGADSTTSTAPTATYTTITAGHKGITAPTTHADTHADTHAAKHSPTSSKRRKLNNDYNHDDDDDNADELQSILVDVRSSSLSSASLASLVSSASSASSELAPSELGIPNHCF